MQLPVLSWMPWLFIAIVLVFRRSVLTGAPGPDIGLAAEATEKLIEQNASTRHLVKVIRVEEGLAMLEQLLGISTQQVMVLPFDLKNLIELYPTAAEMPFLANVGGANTHLTRLYSRPKLRQKYEVPKR
jgi:hypothetical protein